jgi:uncharacterized RDD family membrane protein YckC
MDHNPYAAPRVDVALPEPLGADQELAAKGRRFANLLLDVFSYEALIFVFALVATLSSTSLGASIAAHSLLFGFAMMLTYYVGCETLFGRTLGKLITGTRVVSETGEPATFRQALIRTLCRMVPFEPFSCLGDPPVGWHDRWSGTRVVRVGQANTLGPAYSLRNSGDVSTGPRGLGL